MKVNQVIIALFTLLFQVTHLVSRVDAATLLQQMEWLHQAKNINFVYDSSLKVDVSYAGPDIRKMSVKKALKTLFQKTEFEYTINANYVILKRRTTQQISTSHTNINHKVQRRHTLSGYVRDENGESLINATIYDLTHGLGITTNEYGFFSITLPEGDHQLRFSYVGYADKVEKLKIAKDMHFDMALHADGKLPEVIVNGDLNSPLLTPRLANAPFHKKTSRQNSL